jgi:hypothetical protein
MHVFGGREGGSGWFFFFFFLGSDERLQLIDNDQGLPQSISI